MSYMSRVALRPDLPLQRLASLAGADAYSDHQMLWRLFSDDAQRQRDFLFRRMDEGRRTTFLVVSSRRPRTDSELWAVQTKPYQPLLHQGERLVFSVRINPVVSRRTPDGALKRHDVVMDARRKLESEGIPRPELPGRYQLAEQAGSAWLQARGSSHGFTLISGSVQASAYQRHRLNRKNQRPIRFTTLDLDGQLEVTDPVALQPILHQGLGPAKGFGCGLLLIRRA